MCMAAIKYCRSRRKLILYLKSSETKFDDIESGERETVCILYILYISIILYHTSVKFRTCLKALRWLNA